MPLVKSGFIPIPPGPKPGFDHADLYLDGSGGSRLYLAHTGADRVDVIDCTANTWLRWLPGHPHPDRHTVYALLPASGGAAVYLDQP